MAGPAVVIRPFVDQIQARPRLQRGWEISLAIGFSGFVLLAGRMLGSLPAEGDVVRGLGFLWLVSGCCLMAYLGLKSFVEREENALSHQACWALLIFLGASQISIALLPLQSFLTIIGGLLSLLLLAGFVAHDLLQTPGLSAAMLEPTLDGQSSQEESSAPAPAAVALDAGVAESRSLRTEDDALTQWLTRKQLDDGSEEVEGMIRLELAAGQTQRSAHVSFSPPLAVTPEIECEPLSDGEVEAIVGDVYPHGFRVDIRRGRAAAEAAVVEIGFQAIAAAETKTNAA